MQYLMSTQVQSTLVVQALTYTRFENHTFFLPRPFRLQRFFSFFCCVIYVVFIHWSDCYTNQWVAGNYIRFWFTMLWLDCLRYSYRGSFCCHYFIVVSLIRQRQPHEILLICSVSISDSSCCSYMTVTVLSVIYLV